MKILFLTTTLNDLSQRAYTELTERGHTVAVHALASGADLEARLSQVKPNLIISAFLDRALPAKISQAYTVLSLRPVAGTDRSPASLTGATENRQNWRIRVEQTASEHEAGGIWASQTFRLNPNSERRYYQHHFAQAAVQSILAAVDKLESKVHPPLKPLLNPDPLKRGRMHHVNI